MCRRSDAIDGLRRAADDLSEACAERINAGGAIPPLVQLYDRTVAEAVPREMIELLETLTKERSGFSAAER